jgi:hypothetical protein
VAQEQRAELLAPSAGKPPGSSAYSGRGDLAAWLRIVAIRTALRLRKAENRPRPTEAIRSSAQALRSWII